MRSYHPHAEQVYFVVSPEQNSVKIGHTTHLVGRLSMLQVGNPAPLFLRAAFPGGEIDERALHTQFREYYLGGEWFSVAGALKDYLTTLPAAPEVSWRRSEKRAPGRGDPSRLDAAARRKGAQASASLRHDRSVAFAQALRPTISELQASGVQSLREIARSLNRLGVRTPRGKEWTPVQVQRVIERAGGNE